MGIITSEEKNAFIEIVDELGIPFEIISLNKLREEMSSYNALVVLADEYPEIVDESEAIHRLITHFSEADLPVFCEYMPIPGLVSSKTWSREHTRLIAREENTVILDGIESLSLFETHQNTFLKTEPGYEDRVQEIMSFGRVAGVYDAVYGLPSQTYLGIGREGSLVFSTIRISAFDRMEYRLKVRFGRLLLNLCRFLCGEWFKIERASIRNPFDNRDDMNLDNGMDSGARRKLYTKSLKKGLEWFRKAEMFPNPDGMGGVFEGFTSEFDTNGQKSYRFDEKLGYKIQRADCTADTGLSFYLASQIRESDTLKDKDSELYYVISQNLFHELFSYWQHYDQSILRGLFGWSNSPYDYNVSYSDDNGRVIFESLLYAYCKRDLGAFKRAYSGVIALRNTTGKNGHRWRRIDLKHFYKKKGRRWFRRHRVRRKRYGSPHYDAWTFTALLYGAYLIHDISTVRLVEKGIRDYMKKFPKIHVEHSVGDDFSKLLISCVMLYENTKKKRHREYIDQIVEFFAAYQDPETGAIPEIDPLGTHARTEKSNKKYGTGESALYMDRGDTITDQLYSLGFLAMALFFAYKTGKCSKAHHMLVRLLDYLCSIQLNSKNPQLNGAWTRGFDYRHGEPYGANGDIGWGAYCIETGWTMGPILTSLAMYLLDFDPYSPLTKEFQDKVCQDFVEEKRRQASIEKDWVENTPEPIEHHTGMRQEELNAILMDFKKNSLD